MTGPVGTTTPIDYRSTTTQPAWASYLLAVVGPAATFALKARVAPNLHSQYLFFFPALALIAMLGGLGPGLLATVVSFVLVDAGLLAPAPHFDARHPDDILGAALFVLAGAIVCIAVDRAGRKGSENATLQRNDAASRAARDDAHAKAQELEAVLDSVPAVVLISRLPLSWTMRVNKFGANVVGVQPGTNVSKLAPEGSPPLGYRLMRDGTEIPPNQLPMNVASSKGVEVRGEAFEVVRNDGGVTHLYGNASPLRDGNGNVCGAVGAFLDVTESRRVDERLRAFLTNGPDVLVIADADGMITFVSPNVEEMLGRSASEVVGRSMFQNVHPEDRQRVEASFARGREVAGFLGQVECRVLRPSGQWRTIEIRGRNFLDSPAVHGFLLNLRDVTEQRNLEANMRQSQRMENVGRLAGGIAHDFNNVLTVILAAVGEMKQSDKARSQFDQELVDEIEEAGFRARDLTRQLLLFARRKVASPVPLDLGETITGTLGMLRRLLGEDVEVVSQLDAGRGSVVCDPVQVEQVVVNLAVNARDAMPKGGRLVIETRNVDVTAADVARNADLEPGNWVMLAIRDTGTGMSAEARAHLFEPFFTTKPHGKGTGLGLPTVHGIVENAGGFIAVTSETGKGTSFEVYFPRTSKPQESDPAAPQNVSFPKGTGTVLVVEDDARVRDTVVRTLRGDGYDVLTAVDGLHALELGPDDVARIRLVVTDVMMPGANGRQVVEGLRERKPGLPALFISGYTEDTSAVEGMVDARTQFLAKPFSTVELLAKARTTLANA